MHPDLLPALACLIVKASTQCQVWVVSHARRLIVALEESPKCNAIVLEKNFGQAEVVVRACSINPRGTGRTDDDPVPMPG